MKMIEALPETVSGFPKFFSEFFSTHKERDIETYALIAADTEKNRAHLVRAFGNTLLAKYDSGLTSVCISEFPELSSYTLTDKDKENPYIKSIQDESFIKMEMKVNFKHH